MQLKIILSILIKEQDIKINLEVSGKQYKQQIKMKQNWGEEVVDEGPHKKQKLETVSDNPAYTPSLKIFCNCYSDHEISDLVTAVQGLESYSKIVSVAIRHQQKSLSSLSPKILLMFPELKQRISKMILFARFNVLLLEKITKPWKAISQAEKIKSTNSDCQENEHSHSHAEIQHENHISPNNILNVVQIMAKQWADIGEKTRMPLNKIREFIQKYEKKGSLGQVVIQGTGMGRLTYEILHNFEVESLETYEDSILQYICGQFFLQNKEAPAKVYPFLLNFCNNYSAQTPFTQILLPSQNIVSLKPESLQKLYSNYGYYPSKCLSHTFNSQTDIYISYFCSNRITNILEWIQIVYKNLKEGGIWINVCFSDFDSNAISMCYEQFLGIIRKSQFKMIEEHTEKNQEITISPQANYQKDGKILGPIIRQFAQIFYFVVKK